LFKKKDETKDYIFNAYKVEIFPTEKQIVQINKTFGCSRFVYNHFLASRRDTYKILGESMSLTVCNNICNDLKNRSDYAFLKEVDKFALTNAIINLDKAYTKFFEGFKTGNKSGYPKYKTKKNPCKSYTTNFTNENIKVDAKNGLIQLIASVG
jgi:putative transposase